MPPGVCNAIHPAAQTKIALKRAVSVFPCVCFIYLSLIMRNCNSSAFDRNVSGCILGRVGNGVNTTIPISGTLGSQENGSIRLNYNVAGLVAIAKSVIWFIGSDRDQFYNWAWIEIISGMNGCLNCNHLMVRGPQRGWTDGHVQYRGSLIYLNGQRNEQCFFIAFSING